MKEVGTFQFYKYICVNTQSSQTKTNHCSAPLGMKIFPNNFRPDFPQLKYNKRSSKTGSGGWLNLINCFKIILHRLTGPGLIHRSVQQGSGVDNTGAGSWGAGHWSVGWPQHRWNYSSGEYLLTCLLSALINHVNA